MKAKQAFGTVNQSGQITVSLITPDDWQAYRDYYKGLSSPHHFRGFLEGRDLDAPETYKDLFKNTIGTGSLVMFSLSDGDKMIGQSSINFIETEYGKIALLAGSEIADSYRGQRLVDNFYKARMQHLADIKFEGTIMTTIRPDNHCSQKAAERNGFKNTGTLDKHGYCIFMPVQTQERLETTAQPAATGANKPPQV